MTRPYRRHTAWRHARQCDSPVRRVKPVRHTAAPSWGENASNRGSARDSSSSADGNVERARESCEAGEVDLLVREIGVAGRHLRVLDDEHAEAAADDGRERELRRDAVVNAEL